MNPPENGAAFRRRAVPYFSPPRIYAVCRGIATSGLVAALAALIPSSAQAQYGTAAIQRPRKQAAATDPLPSHFTIGPAMFLGVDDNLGTTRTVAATVLAVETSFDTGMLYAVQAGGFAYVRGSDGIAQLQVKGYFNPSIGVQLGYQRSIKGGGRGGYSGYLLYNLSSTVLDPPATKRWDVQFGLGTFRAALDEQEPKNAFSGFVQLSVQLSRRNTLDLSYWGIAPEKDSSINRFFLGYGMNF